MSAPSEAPRRRRSARFGRLPARLAALWLLLVVALSAVAVLSIRQLGTVYGLAARTAEVDLKVLDDAAHLDGLLYQNGFVSDYFYSHDPHWLEELAQAHARFSAWLETTKSRPAAAPARGVLDRIAGEYAQYDRTRESAVAIYNAGDETGARLVLKDAYAQATHLLALSQEFFLSASASVRSDLDAARAAWRRALLLIATVTVIGIALSAGAGFAIARSISRPLYELVLRAEQAGDPTDAGASARIEIRRPDEIDALDEHLTRLIGRIDASNQELEEQRRRLAQSEKLSAVGELAAKLAHEILNPLTGIKATLQVLQRTGASPDTVRETARTVDAEVGRVEGMVRRLLAYSKPFQPRIQPTAVGELLDRSLAAARHDLEARRIEVARTVDAALPELAVDPELLVQALVNLLRNAAEASPEGGTVEVRAGARTHGVRSYAVLEVRDRGPGVPPERRAKLFAPFFTTKEGGHGLGLAVALNILTAHGGRLTLEPADPSALAREAPPCSDAEREAAPGACFAAWIPLAR